MEDFVRLCAVLYFRLTKKELGTATSNPEAQSWNGVFRMLRFEVELLVYKFERGNQIGSFVQPKEQFFSNAQHAYDASKLMPKEEEYFNRSNCLDWKPLYQQIPKTIKTTCSEDRLSLNGEPWSHRCEVTIYAHVTVQEILLGASLDENSTQLSG